MSLLLALLLSQAVSADGRSLEGQQTTLDVVVAFLAPDKLLTGLDCDQLLQAGEVLYPQEGREHNRAAHRLGARLLTDRFGVVGAQTLGILNELFEAHNMRHTGEPYFSTTRFDWGDVGANVRGSVDSVTWGLLLEDIR